jgi:hypothetical protein
MVRHGTYGMYQAPYYIEGGYWYGERTGTEVPKMKEIIKLIGKYNDLELGYVENNTYYETGLLADDLHSWKILNWIDTEIGAGHRVQVVKVKQDMMDESKAKNKAALEKIVKNAFKLTGGPR